MKITMRWLFTMLLGLALAVAGAAHAQTTAKSLTSYIGCVNDPLPGGPGTSPFFQLVNASAIGFADVIVWRQVCLDNPNNSMILMRVAPYPIGDSLLTGANITALQNGATIGPFNLLQTTRDVAGYVGFLNRTTTFIVAQTNLLPTLLNENGAFKLVFSAGHDTATLDIPTRGFENAVLTTVAEFFNANIRHYFITANQAEKAALDAGGGGGGWARTGQSFTALFNAVVPGTAPVCRFYAGPPAGNTHFFTANHDECAQVSQNPDWKFEGIAFFAVPSVTLTDSCAAQSLRPVFRFYNQRGVLHDSNHRYVVDASLIPVMLGQGWVNEGVVMCVPLQ